MRQLKHLCLLATLAVLTFACQKELSNENGNPDNLDSQWEFTETAGFKGTIDTAYLEPSGAFQSLVFEGPSSDGRGAIYMQVFGTAINASTFKNPNVNFIYVENGSTVYSNVPTSVDKFTVVITTINATSVSGTFDGEVENAAGEIKTITNGKFTAVLKQVAPPPLQNLCKLRNIGILDPVTGRGYESVITSYNSSNQVINIKNLDSANSKTLLDFPITYTANRVNLDADQHFELDANGRIKTFRGFLNAGEDTSSSVVEVIINYSYNANGNITKSEYALAALPTVTALQIDFTWTNGNLTRSVQSSAGSLQRVEFEYVYDATKTVKEFIALFPSPELFYTQTAINYGKNSVNVPSRSTLKIYDDTGVKTDEAEATYTDYVIDAKNYVTSFKVNGQGSVLRADTRYALSYHCY